MPFSFLSAYVGPRMCCCVVRPPPRLGSFRDIVLYRHKDLTKASKIVLQPHSSAFLKMSNHQAVMETELRHYSAISRGETPTPRVRWK